MVSKAQLIDEVLALVDATPLTEIDVRPILDKYTNGVDFNGQKTIRQNLDSAISDLVRIKDIRSRNCNFSASSGGQFLSNSGLVASTIERKEKLEQIERDKNKKGVTNNQYIGVNNGTAAQGSTLSETDFRPLEKPIARPNQNIQKNRITAAINWVWDIVNKYPLISGIIAAVIAGLILAKVFGISI